MAELMRQELKAERVQEELRITEEVLDLAEQLG